MKLTEKDEKRFWAKVAPADERGCMLWTSAISGARYAVFTLERRTQLAHRISYTLAYGPIPDGLVIDHVKARGCRGPGCVAPLHLEAVTQLENMRRGRGGAWQRAKTHCPSGHPYAGENLILRKGGRRRLCRECNRAAQDRYYQRKKAA